MTFRAMNRIAAVVCCAFFVGTLMLAASVTGPIGSVPNAALASMPSLSAMVSAR